MESRSTIGRGEALFEELNPKPRPDKYFFADHGGQGEAIEAYFCTLIEPSPKSNEELRKKTQSGCWSSNKVRRVDA